MANKLGAVNDVGLAGAKKGMGGVVGKGKGRGSQSVGNKAFHAPHTHTDGVGHDIQPGVPKISKSTVNKYHAMRGKLGIPGALANNTGITLRKNTKGRPQTL